MKSYVTLEKRCCPACGRTFDTNNLLFDTLLRDRFEMHTVTGFDLCPEHQEMVEKGYRIFVEIDRAKSSGSRPQDVYRTGPIAFVRSEVADQVFPTSKGHPMIWVEPGLIDKLQEMAT